jgi:hypothetical protein
MHKVNYRYYCHFPGLEFVWLPESLEGLPSQGREDGRILKITYFSENYIPNNDWQCHYILGGCCNVRRTKPRRKTRALWGISSYS